MTTLITAAKEPRGGWVLWSLRINTFHGEGIDIV